MGVQKWGRGNRSGRAATGEWPGPGTGRSALVVRQISRSGRELGVALDDLKDD